MSIGRYLGLLLVFIHGPPPVGKPSRLLFPECTVKSFYGKMFQGEIETSVAFSALI